MCTLITNISLNGSTADHEYVTFKQSSQILVAKMLFLALGKINFVDSKDHSNF